MANYNEIKAILQKSVGGALNAQELDNLAKAIVSSTGAAGAVDTASIQKQRDLAAVLGRVAEMRKLDVSLAEKQFEIAKLNVKAAIDQLLISTMGLSRSQEHRTNTSQPHKEQQSRQRRKTQKPKRGLKHFRKNKRKLKTLSQASAHSLKLNPMLKKQQRP